MGDGVQQMGRRRVGVRAASASSIEITFQYNGIQCRERIGLKPTPLNLDRAESHRKRIIEAIDNLVFDYAATFPNSKNIAKFQDESAFTLGEYLNKWLKDKKPQIKTSTYQGYQKIFTFAAPKLGHIPLSELKRKDVAQFAARLECGNKRISNILSAIRAALTDAVYQEIIDSNPIAGWTYKKVMPPKRIEIDPFTKEEQAEILKQLTGQGYNLIKFAFWSGLRTSELVAIEWGDIDWGKETIRIQRAKTQYAEKAETTKTLSSVREVKLLAPALEALIAQKPYTFIRFDKIFHNPRTEKPWTGDQPIRKTLWSHALKKAGVRYRKPYQTRHTFASMMLSSGETLAWVSKMLGHSNVLQTARTYATWIPDTAPNAGLRAVEIFGKTDESGN